MASDFLASSRSSPSAPAGTAGRCGITGVTRSYPDPLPDVDVRRLCPFLRAFLNAAQAGGLGDLEEVLAADLAA
jgi:hypothetical protein